MSVYAPAGVHVAGIGSNLAGSATLPAVLIDRWLPRAAALPPPRVALRTPEAEVSYRELWARAAGAAVRLEPGSHVALEGTPGVEFAVALHACLLAGAVAVPIDPPLAAPQRAALLARTVPYPGEGVAPARPERPPPADTGDAALVVHTSGTTAAPRPVVLTHGNLLANALGSAAAMGLLEDERWLCPLPLSHVGGLMVLVRSAVYGTTAVLQPPPFDPEAAAAA